MKLHSLMLVVVAGAAVPAVTFAQETAGEGASKASEPAAIVVLPAGGEAGAEAPSDAATPAAAVDRGKGPDGAEANRFVDRDGDGIQDGQEHRFRRHGTGAPGRGKRAGPDGGGGLFRRGAGDGSGGGRGAGNGECVGQGSGK